MRDRALLAALGLAAVIYLALTWPLATAMIDDLAVIRTFGGDETRIVETTLAMVNDGAWDPADYRYGGLYYQLPALALSVAGRISAHQTAWALRLVSVLGGLAAIAGLVLLSGRVFGREAALAAAGLTCALPFLIYWGGFIHPDTWDLAAVAAAWGLILAALKEERPVGLIWAALAAGLSAGLKMSGLFLLPVIIFGIIWLAIKPPQAFWSRPSLAGVSGLILAGGLAAGGGIFQLLGRPFWQLKAIQLVIEESGRADLAPFWVMRASLLGAALIIGAGLLALGVAAAWACRFLARHKSLASFFSLSLAAALAFGVGFLAVNNLAPVRFGAVGAFFLEQSVRLSQGWSRPEWFWWSLALKEEVWGAFPLALSLAGLAWGLVRPAVSRQRLLFGLLAGWLLFYIGHLSLNVSAPFPRYGLSLIPPLIFLAASFIGRAGRVVALRSGHFLVGLAVGLLLLYPVLQADLDWDMDYRREAAARADQPAMAVGRWLAETYPPATTIQHDPYLYVPLIFERSEEDWTPTLAEAKARSPQLIITNQGFFRRFFEETEAGRFLPAQRAEAREFYQALLKDGLDGRYVETKSFGQITVWARQDG